MSSCDPDSWRLIFLPRPSWSHSNVYSRASTLVILTSSPRSCTIPSMRPGPQPCDHRGCPPLQTGKNPRLRQFLSVNPLFPADPGKTTSKPFVSRTSKTKDFKSFIARTSKKYRGGHPSFHPGVGKGENHSSHLRPALFPRSFPINSFRISRIRTLLQKDRGGGYSPRPLWAPGGRLRLYSVMSVSAGFQLSVSVPLWPIPAAWSGGTNS